MREILKAVFMTGSGSGGRLLLNMFTMKIMAVILGPSGVGLYSLLRSAMDFSSKFGTLGGETALVQGLANRKERARDEYIVTTFWIFVLGALLIVAVLVVFAPWIALWVFDRKDGQTTNLVRGLALPVTLAVAAAYLNCILNGFRALGLLALVQTLAAAAILLLAYPVSRLVEVGYPIAFIVMMSAGQTVNAALGVRAALQAGWLAPLLSSLRTGFSSKALQHFFSIAGVTLVADLVMLGTGLAVRALIVRQSGLVEAGFFAVAWTLSMTYIMLVLTSFGTYYLPTLSQIGDPLARIVLMQRMIRLTTLLMVPLVTGLIVLKPLAVNILYSGDFIASLKIIRWMLLGDYLKATAWIFSTPMIAYVHMKVFFGAEMLWSLGFLTFATASLYGFGSVEGLGIAFLLAYALYLVYCLYYARSQHRFPLTRGNVGPWVLGLALIVGASWHTWTDTQVNWFAVPLRVGAAVSFSWLALNRDERREVLRAMLRRVEVRS
jgi:O-antigen/teichoic acid export membrane protein